MRISAKSLAASNMKCNTCQEVMCCDGNDLQASELCRAHDDTYLNDKAKPHVEPLARRLEAAIFLPCNVTEPVQLEAVFAAVREHWGRLDLLLRGIAWARKEDLHGRLTDCSAACRDIFGRDPERFADGRPQGRWRPREADVPGRWTDLMNQTFKPKENEQ